MYSKTTIVGRLGRDPELKEFDGDKVNCKFSVATSDYKNETEWFSVTVWGNQARASARYLKKGALVLVEGTLKTRQYEKDGETKRFTSLNASKVVFLNTKKEAEEGDGIDENDKIPF